MSNNSWQSLLKQFLANRDNPLTRLAVVGIGNEFNGDDAAGVVVLNTLRQQFLAQPNLMLVQGATAPENFSGPLRTFRPDYLLIIDAADLQDLPGSICFLQMEEVDGFGASTHTLPPSTLARYLQHETGCQVGFLGIQPMGMAFDTSVSVEVEKAIQEVCEEPLKNPFIKRSSQQAAIRIKRTFPCEMVLFILFPLLIRF